MALVAGALTGGTAASAAAAASSASSASDAAEAVTGATAGHANSCIDTPLTITFASAPTLGTTGSITVHNADGSVADTIDLADPASATETVGGATDQAGNLHSFNYFPVIITGDTATVYLHHELAYGHAYYVTVDPTVFTGVTDPPAWRFSTTSRRPRPHARIITVDSRGHGDFCTVQGAINAVPAGNTMPRLIRVANGVYTELDWVAPDKPLITVQGQSRSGTVIQYANNNTLNAANTTDVCARQAIPVHDNFNCWRSNFNVEANDFTMKDLTLSNTTPFGGSQAEAFRGNAERITLNRVNLLSFQDTIRIQGLGYVTNSYIQGDVDFTWGVGTVFWTHDELKSMHAGYVTQIRNSQGQHGYVFFDDTLTHATGVADGSVYLGRIDPTGYPYSQAVYIGTAMDSHINPAGWLLNNADCSAATHVQFWEYGSVNLAGQPVDTSQRLACSRQLTAAEAAQWSDPAFVLGGWVPATVNAMVIGAGVAVNWSAPAGHAASDVVALCAVRASRCVAAARVGTAASIGTASLPLPPGRGVYQVRYYANGRVTAVSAPLLPSAAGKQP
ncbi:MAG TPA: pectinesterase family protein [Streptosporangiaceae bacterium]|nr:pectinesterase family protein [Streptosporangiaceae bacterium]